jgi:hypothetical protein
MRSERLVLLSARSNRSWHDTETRAMRIADEKLWDIAKVCEVDSRAVCLLFERNDIQREAGSDRQSCHAHGSTIESRPNVGSTNFTKCEVGHTHSP